MFAFVLGSYHPSPSSPFFFVLPTPSSVDVSLGFIYSHGQHVRVIICLHRINILFALHIARSSPVVIFILHSILVSSLRLDSLPPSTLKMVVVSYAGLCFFAAYIPLDGRVPIPTALFYNRSLPSIFRCSILDPHSSTKRSTQSSAAIVTSCIFKIKDGNFCQC